MLRRLFLLTAWFGMIPVGAAEEPKEEKLQPWDVPNHTMQKAGYPLHIACYAQPSETHAYKGYYVGGGTPCGGRYPAPNEGTWGWDYSGCLFHRRIFLGWWRGYQGGVGSYRVDGPQVFPNIRK